MAAAETFIAKPKLARLKSWLSMRRRVPSLPQAPDREKVRSTPQPVRTGRPEGQRSPRPQFQATGREHLKITRLSLLQGGSVAACKCWSALAVTYLAEIAFRACSESEGR